MGKTRRYDKDTQPSRPRGPVRSRWHMVHDSDRDYRRRSKHPQQDDLLAEYEEEQEEELLEELSLILDNE